VQRVFSAFIQKNELFPDTPPEQDSPDDTFESVSRLINMMRTVEKIENPQLKKSIT
jgi:hypothetical protein